ncbi:hypothetical protein ACH5RR_025339 [Cinchona calisaya]|uniref:Cytochrome P450 n=1 Tax=Cinchona calisaya TaxID=153742 RepID=A0ABD2YZC5_9GENT
MGEWFEELFLNIIVRKIAGMRRYTDSEVRSQKNAEFRGVVKELFHLMGKFIVSDVIPFPLLKWIDMQGHIKSIKRVSKEIDNFVQISVDDPNDREMKSEPWHKEQDFIDALFSIIKEDTLCGHSRVTVIKALLMGLIIAGFETTSVPLTWILSLLLNNKHVMKRAQEEVGTRVGKDKWVEESDIKN